MRSRRLYMPKFIGLVILTFAYLLIAIVDGINIHFFTPNSQSQ